MTAKEGPFLPSPLAQLGRRWGFLADDNCLYHSCLMAMRADYGLDAPSVVRNLALVAVAALLLFGSIALGFWSGRVPLGGQVVLEVSSMALAIGLATAGMALYMVWSSKLGKMTETSGNRRTSPEIERRRRWRMLSSKA
jgi:hypothetical protein